MDTDESGKSRPNSASLEIDDTSSVQDWPVLILPVVDQPLAMRNFLPQPLVRPGLTSGVEVSLTTQERLLTSNDLLCTTPMVCPAQISICRKSRQEGISQHATELQ